jgi:DtxR family Mn-dependent transcriptional regulator
LTILLMTIASLGLLAVALWPERGLYHRWRRARARDERDLMEDALKQVLACSMAGERPTLGTLSAALRLSSGQTLQVLEQLQARELIEWEEDHFRLTPSGHEIALHVLRAHRLWERYLADETGFEEAEWHALAERYEHRLTPGEAEELAARLGYPRRDPHGDPIPSSEGEMLHQEPVPLPSAEVDQPLWIVHVEDEPEVIYAQLAAEGLHAGMHVRLIEVTPQRVLFWADGDEHVLAPVVASNLHVEPLPEDLGVPPCSANRLSGLGPGQSAQILGISPACRGRERRRLMDLGILPGTEVQAAFVSPSGDPTAYRVRGALLALRREQADLIYLREPEKEPP